MAPGAETAQVQRSVPDMGQPSLQAGDAGRGSCSIVLGGVEPDMVRVQKMKQRRDMRREMMTHVYSAQHRAFLHSGIRC
eukprot:2041547-Rhodomonas_salina.1